MIIIISRYYVPMSYIYIVNNNFRILSCILCAYLSIEIKYGHIQVEIDNVC